MFSEEQFITSNVQNKLEKRQSIRSIYAATQSMTMIRLEKKEPCTPCSSGDTRNSKE